MGIHVYWRDERRKNLGLVSDPQMLFSDHILASSWPGTACLRFIDAYGETVFNQRQIDVFIEELERSKASVENTITSEHLDDVLSLARRASGEIHTYLWFVGD